MQQAACICFVHAEGRGRYDSMTVYVNRLLGCTLIEFFFGVSVTNNALQNSYQRGAGVYDWLCLPFNEIEPSHNPCSFHESVQQVVLCKYIRFRAAERNEIVWYAQVVQEAVLRVCYTTACVNVTLGCINLPLICIVFFSCVVIHKHCCRKSLFFSFYLFFLDAKVTSHLSTFSSVSVICMYIFSEAYALM